MSSVNIENLLYDEIEHVYNKASELEPGTEQHKVAGDTGCKMLDKVIEMQKIELDYKERKEARESELQFKREQMENEKQLRREQIKSEALIKQQQLRDEKRHRYVQTGVTVGTTLASIWSLAWAVRTSLDFEKTGTITTAMGRSLLNRFIPKL